MTSSARLLPFLLCGALTAATPAAAQNAPAFDWRGVYLGYHLGGALNLAEFKNPFGASIFGDTVRTPGPIVGGQLGYNWQTGATLIGVEADMSWAKLDGTNTCFAYSGRYVSANCRASVDALGTLAGRLGWIASADGQTLVYGKAGLAWADSKVSAKPNGRIEFAGTHSDGFNWGWTIGGGIERAVSNRWTVKTEYGLLSFDQSLTAPKSRIQTVPGGHTFRAVPATHTDVSHNIHVFKLGMSYRLGAQSNVRGTTPSRSSAHEKGYALSTGARYVYGWGQFHKDLGLRSRGVTALASRLTYDNESANGGEAFARLDTPFGLVIKGLYGGANSGGRLNDEDWMLAFGPNVVSYSNTLSRVDNEMHYGIADAGYALWRGERYSVAPFVGYTRFQQNLAGLGCRQIANRRSDCVPTIPGNIRVITEDDTWEALRLGAVAKVALTPELTLTGDAAYLPYVKFEGTDFHVLRSLVSPEDGDGVGVQVEATLSYDLTDALSVGVGGRYWAMWTTKGTTNFGGTGHIVPQRFAAEQAQLFVQGAYRFDFGTSRR